ncbi:MAG: hypothetical protein KDD62_12465 [Bdellovibrionales bacterium]|nr:hypothetical protein [Bdellovibrionales bacterium]
MVDLILLGFIGLFFVLIFLVAIPRSMKKLREGFERDIPLIFPDGDCQIVKSESKFLAFMGRTMPRVSREGIDLDIVFTTGRSGDASSGPSVIYFYVPLRHQISLLVEKESIGSALSKVAGLSRDIEIGIRELDAALVFTSRDKDRAEQLLRDESFLDILKQLKAHEKFIRLGIKSAFDDFVKLKKLPNQANHDFVYADRDYGSVVDWPGIFIGYRGTENTWKEEKEVIQDLVNLTYRLVVLLKNYQS